MTNTAIFRIFKFKDALGLFITGLWVYIAVGQVSPDSVNIEFLDEVVLSDSRYALKRQNSGKTVILISETDLARQKGRTLPDILNGVAGLEFSGSRGRPGEVIGVFARGGRGRQVVIFIDGVRVNDPSSFSQEYDLRLLDLAEVQSIEIIKGAASTLYGANAATAVIRITTKTASANTRAAVFQSTLGTQNPVSPQRFNISEVRNSAYISGRPGKLYYGLSFNQHYSNGLSSIAGENAEKDPNSRFGATFKVGLNLRDSSDIQFYANLSNFNTEYDEAFGLTDAAYRFTSRQKRVGLSAKLAYKKGMLHMNAAYSGYDSENISAFPGTFKGDNLIADVYNRLRIGKYVHTVLGLNYVHETAALEPEADYYLADPYFNLVYTGPKGLNLNLGARLNAHSEYGTRGVYAFNPSYLIRFKNSAVKLLGSLGTAYITPSLSQLFGQFGANPDLEPEENTTLELGTEFYSGSTLRINALYFKRKEENFVFFNNQTFTYDNAEETIDARGVELEMDYRISNRMQLQANYTFTERMGDNAIRIPKHKINANFTIQPSSQLGLTLTYNYTGKRRDTDFTTFEDVTLESFALIGVSARYQLLPGRALLFLRADNLLNTDYTEVLGFTTRGRNFALGLQLSF